MVISKQIDSMILTILNRAKSIGINNPKVIVIADRDNIWTPVYNNVVFVKDNVERVYVGVLRWKELNPYYDPLDPESEPCRTIENFVLDYLPFETVRGADYINIVSAIRLNIHNPYLAEALDDVEYEPFNSAYTLSSVAPDHT